MSWLRSAAISSDDRLPTSLPLRLYSPEVGRSRQPRRFMSVDLPEPEGPMSATISPAKMRSETPFSASTFCSPRS